MEDWCTIGHQSRSLNLLRLALILHSTLCGSPREPDGGVPALEPLLRRSHWLGLILAALSCAEPKYADTEEGASSAVGGDGVVGVGDAGTSTDDDEEDDEHWRTVRARVQVDLYTTNDEGGREFLSWDDAVGPAGEFPFGSIFVAAIQTESTMVESTVAQHTVIRPRTDGDYYRLKIDPEAAETVSIFATLDVRGDGIVGSGEPSGIYPDALEVVAYAEDTEANIVILVDWDRWGPGGWGWQDVGGYVPPRDTDGDGDIDEDDAGCELVSVAGDVRITVPYEGGNGKVMLLDNNGGGPYQMVEFTPIPNGSGGGIAEYNLGLCAWAGDMKIVAAYDSNGNGLIDPDDMWGGHVSEPGVDGNPVTIEDYRQTDIHIEVPLGDGGPAVSVVPFVHLSGVAYPESVPTFAGFGEEDGDGVALYVAALRYPLTPDMDVEDFTDAYDFVVWDSDALGDSASVEWDLIVPANTVVYLVAFVDVDGDGLVNEEQEPVAFGGVGGAAALSTGDEGYSGLGLGLSVVEG